MTQLLNNDNNEILTSILAHHAHTTPDKTAYIFLEKGKEKSRISYKELYESATRIAGHLQKSNLKGERVLLIYPSSIEFVSAFMGCLYAGVIAVPTYLPENDRIITRIKTIIKDCKPKVILSNNDSIDFTYEDENPDITFINTSNIENENIYQNIDISPSDIAFLQYTSGSTSSPKGAMVTQKNITYNLSLMEKNYGLNIHTTTVSWLPIHHDMGLIVGLLESMYLGGKTVLMSTNDFMKAPLLWLKAISKYRGTFTAAPNFAYDLCNMKKISPEIEKTLDLSSWQVSINGAEPIKSKSLEKFTRKFKNLGFQKEIHAPSYGMAETTVFISASKHNQKPIIRSFNKELLELSGKAEIAAASEDKKRLVSCGQGEMMEKLFIVNPESHVRCADGTVGEIWVKDPSVAAGYWHKEEITKEIFHAYEKTTGEGPFLRTGDLGFIYKNELYIAGRHKDLIIIRGQNIYPQDIELITEEAHPSLRKNCAACFSIEKDGEEQLVIAQEIRGEQNTQEIFYKIMERVSNEYSLIPYDIVFIKRGTISKTTSGKIQRQLSKKLYLEKKLEIISSLRQTIGQTKGSKLTLTAKDFVPLKTNIEQALAKIWIDTLHLDKHHPISSNDNFFYLGGNSILAANVIAQIQLKLKKEISFKDFFKNPTIHNLAHLISISKTTHNPPLLVQEKPKNIPLSLPQERLWFIDQFEKNPNYNIPIKITLKGTLDQDILFKSLKRIVKRHESLRSSIENLDGLGIQKIHKNVKFPIEKIDLTSDNLQKLSTKISGLKNIQPLEEANWLKNNKEKIANQIISSDANIPFDLKSPPLFRAKLIRLAEDENILYLNIHHIISDGWSVYVFSKELTSLYNSYIEGKTAYLPRLPVQYSDYSIWQRKSVNREIIAGQLEYWENALKDANHILNFPTDNPRPKIQTNNSDQLKISIKKELIEGLSNIAKKENVSLFMIFLSGLYILLRRYSNQNDISIGIPIAGRQQKNTENLIGFFVNTIIMRINGNDNCTIKELIEQAKTTALNGYENQDAPFEQVVNKVAPERDLSRSPLFQILFAYQNIKNPELKLKDLSSELEQINSGNTEFDISFILNIFEESDQDVDLILEYNSDLFEPETIDRISKHFVNILNSFNSNLGTEIDKIDFLEKEEKQKILVDWNDTKAEYPKDKCIHELFSEQAKRTPDKTAVIYEGNSLTYQELDRESDKVAAYLQSIGAKPDQLIAICIDRSLEMVVGILGILKSGAAYLPIDAEYPEDRIKYIINDSKANIIVTQNHALTLMNEICGEKIIVNITKILHTENSEYVNSMNNINANNLAYTIYTSGSTGTPKGVTLTHRTITNLITWQLSTQQFQEDLNVINFTSINFDVSLQEIFFTLCSGKQLYIPTLETKKDFNLLVDFICKNNINTIFLPYVSLHHLINYLLLEREKELPIKYIITAGEQLIINDTIKRFFISNPNIKLYNHYGPSESHVATSYLLAKEAVSWDIVPSIGTPIGNMEVYILDKHLKPVPIGVIGEIYISGEGLAREYLNKPKLTNQKFINNPFIPGTKMYKTGDLAKYSANSNILFSGRIDHQVKIRGFRIEIGEIESVINTYKTITDNIVIVKSSDNNDKQLLCFYTALHGNIEIEHLKKHLRSKLPDYMIPLSFVLLDKIPLTPNGKVDRKLLERKDIELTNSDKHEAPRTNIEKKLLDIWKAVLNIKNIGINDNYFSLGGDSIKSIQIIYKAREINLNFSIKDIFQYQTIKELAASNKKPGLVKHCNLGSIEGKLPLTPIQEWFFSRQQTKLSHWNQSISLGIRKEFSVKDLKNAVAQLIDHHDNFRLRYKNDNGLWKQFYDSQSNDLPITLFDLTDVNNKEEFINEKSALLEQSLDIESGPVVRFGYFHSKTKNHLYIAVHHLVIDGVSWRIILEDLSNLLKSPSKKVNLPEKTASYKLWSEKLGDYANSKILAKEKTYWNKQYEISKSITPLISNYEVFKVKDTDEIKISLSEVDTKNLLLKSNNKFKTEINDLLLTGFFMAYHKWSNNDKMQIDLEGHGREDIHEEIDISRTVGWFTSVFPVILSAPDTDNMGEKIKHTKQILRSVPNKGMGFGVLKYLGNNSELKSFPNSQIAFNYLGEFNVASNDILELSDQFMYASYAEEAECNNQIAVNGLVKDNELFFLFTYNSKLFSTKAVYSFAKMFKESLEKIIQYCSSTDEKPSYQHIIPTSLLAMKPEKQDNLIVFNKEKSDSSFFAFPGILGIPSYYQNFFQSLDINCNCYGINNYNILENTNDYKDINDLSGKIADVIIDTKPNSECYHLLGHSFGSIVAYETASQLEGRGKKTSLIICDQEAGWQANDFSSITEKSLFNSLFFNIATLLQIDNITNDFAFMGMWNRLTSKEEVIEMLHKLLIWNNANVYLDDVKKLVDAIQKNYQLSYNFDQGKSVREITLLKALDNKMHDGLFVNRTLGWEKHSKQEVQHFNTPGNHFTMFHKPHIYELTQRLYKLLDNTLFGKDINDSINIA